MWDSHTLLRMSCRRFTDRPSCMSLWKTQFFLRPCYCNLDLRLSHNHLFWLFYIDRQINTDIAVMGTGICPRLQPIFPSSFCLSFTSYRGQRLSLHKWAALTNTLGSARHSSLSSPCILATNHYISNENGVFHMKLQTEWENEVTASETAYCKHLLLFLARQQSKPYFILGKRLLQPCMCLGER